MWCHVGEEGKQVRNGDKWVKKPYRERGEDGQERNLALGWKQNSAKSDDNQEKIRHEHDSLENKTQIFQ